MATTVEVNHGIARSSNVIDFDTNSNSSSCASSSVDLGSECKSTDSEQISDTGALLVFYIKFVS